MLCKSLPQIFFTWCFTKLVETFFSFKRTYAKSKEHSKGHSPHKNVLKHCFPWKTTNPCSLCCFYLKKHHNFSSSKMMATKIKGLFEATTILHDKVQASVFFGVRYTLSVVLNIKAQVPFLFISYR